MLASARQTMRLLALDTASPAPALALLVSGAGGGAPRVATEPLGAAAAESLPERLRAFLAREGIPLGEIERIAVLSGPGSFTGLRAGTAFARGLARARGVPLVSASTFRAAAAALPAGDADILLDAGRGEVHRARVRGGALAEDPKPIPLGDALREAERQGVAAIRLEQPAQPALPLAEALARLAEREEESGVRLLYGRPSAAEERWGAG